MGSPGNLSPRDDIYQSQKLYHQYTAFQLFIVTAMVTLPTGKDWYQGQLLVHLSSWVLTRQGPQNWSQARQQLVAHCT